MKLLFIHASYYLRVDIFFSSLSHLISCIYSKKERKNAIDMDTSIQTLCTLTMTMCKVKWHNRQQQKGEIDREKQCNDTVVSV